MMLSIALGYLGMETPIAKVLLLAGSVLGLAVIPAYFVGYRALAMVYPLSPRGFFLACAAVVAGCGAVTHGLTGLDIYQAVSAGAQTRPPAEAFAEPSLLMLTASLSAVACLAASIIIVVTDARMTVKSMRPIPFVNPVIGSIVLTAVSASLGSVGDFLGPAAPNLAHFAFFIVARHTVSSGTGKR